MRNPDETRSDDDHRIEVLLIWIYFYLDKIIVKANSLWFRVF